MSAGTRLWTTRAGWSELIATAPTGGTGLLLMLIVLPLYVGRLAEELRAGHLKTEQALKECLEREQCKT